MLVIEDQPHAGVLMNPQHVGGAEPDVVVFEHKRRCTGSGSVAHGLHPTAAACRPVAVGAADMNHQDRFGTKLHQVEHLGLRGQVPHAAPDQRRIGL